MRYLDEIGYVCWEDGLLSINYSGMISPLWEDC